MRERPSCSTGTGYHRGSDVDIVTSPMTDAVGLNESDNLEKKLDEALAAINEVAIAEANREVATKLLKSTTAVNALFRTLCRMLDFERGWVRRQKRSRWPIHRGQKLKRRQQGKRTNFQNWARLDRTH